MLNLFADKGFRVQADVNVQTVGYLCMCTRVCLYMQLSASADFTFSQLSSSVTQPPLLAHPRVSLGWILEAGGEGGCLVLLWGPKPVNDAGHQKPHRWLI